jgi:hypothetical protein
VPAESLRDLAELRYIAHTHNLSLFDPITG